MRLTGEEGVAAYLTRYEGDSIPEVDDDLVYYLNLGYVEWDSETEQFSMTNLGMLFSYEGTMH